MDRWTDKRPFSLLGVDSALCALVRMAGRAEANFQPLLHIGDEDMQQTALGDMLAGLFQGIRVFQKRRQDVDDEIFGKIFGEGRRHKPPRQFGIGLRVQKKAKQRPPAVERPPVLTDTGRCSADMYSTPMRCAEGRNRKTPRFTPAGGHWQRLRQGLSTLGDFRVPEAGRDVKGGDLLYVFDSPVNASDHIYNPRLTGYPKDKEQQAKTYITNYTRPKPSQKTFPPWGL